MEGSTRGKLAKVVTAILLLLVAAGVLTYYFMPAHVEAAPTRGYYFNLSTGDLVEDAIGKGVPFEGTDGAQIVRAHVFSCGDCSDEASRFVGYLEAMKDPAGEPAPAAGRGEGLAEFRQSPAMRARQAQNTAVVASAEEPTKWISAENAAAAKITSAADTRCGRPGIARRCHPPGE